MYLDQISYSSVQENNFTRVTDIVLGELPVNKFLSLLMIDSNLKNYFANAAKNNGDNTIQEASKKIVKSLAQFGVPRLINPCLKQPMAS